MFLILLAGGIGLVFAINNNKSNIEQINVSANLTKVANEQTIKIEEEKVVMPVKAEPVTTEDSQISSDGTRRVIVRTTGNNDSDIKSVQILTRNEKNGDEQAVFNNSISKDGEITAPYNAWSPDNKYFFVQQNSAQGTSIMVFKEDGQPFGDGETYLDLTGIFKDRVSAFDYKEATGWASETLIIVNTSNKEGSDGPSYWFEVPSKAVIQLSSKF